MKNTCVYWQTVKRFAVLLTITASFVSSLAARTNEIQIMVNGPWSYLPDPDDPNNRILLLVPKVKFHEDIAIFPGPEAHKTIPPDATKLPPGRYKMAVSGPSKPFDKADCDAIRPHVPPTLYKLNVGAAPIGSAIQGNTHDPEESGTLMSRYAISLPVPCFYSSMHEDSSMMWTNTYPNVDTQYTTWMAFHYSSKSGDALSVSLEGQSLTLDSPAYYPFPSMSIVMPSQDDYKGSECDPVSIMSLHKSATLIGQYNQIHVQFPVTLGSTHGAYQTHHYSDPCKTQAYLHVVEQRLQDEHALIHDIHTVRSYIEHQDSKDYGKARQSLDELDKTLNKEQWLEFTNKFTCELQAAKALLQEVKNPAMKSGLDQPECDPSRRQEYAQFTVTEQVVLVSAGHSDCHSAQININGAIK